MLILSRWVMLIVSVQQKWVTNEIMWQAQCPTLHSFQPCVINHWTNSLDLQETVYLGLCLKPPAKMRGLSFLLKRPSTCLWHHESLPQDATVDTVAENMASTWSFWDNLDCKVFRILGWHRTKQWGDMFVLFFHSFVFYVGIFGHNRLPLDGIPSCRWNSRTVIHIRLSSERVNSK